MRGAIRKDRVTGTRMKVPGYPSNREADESTEKPLRKREGRSPGAEQTFIPEKKRLSGICFPFGEETSAFGGRGGLFPMCKPEDLIRYG
jgi:hypothetical protein